MQVPHFFQSSEQTCGATCLRMSFAALAVAHDEATIAQHCGTTGAGSTVQDLATGAQSLGFNAAVLHFSGYADASAALAQIGPFVAMIDLAELTGGPMFHWHFVVILEMTIPTWSITILPVVPIVEAQLDAFLSAWAVGGYLGVRVWIP